jgi:hypothetical protein
MSEIIIATEGIILDDGFKFLKDVNLSEFISEFKEHVVICRNCGMEAFCSVMDHDDVCHVADNIVENFIRTHILRIDSSSRKEVKDLCQCLYDLMNIFETIKIWIGTLADNSLVEFFIGKQPELTLKYGHRLIAELGEMFEHYISVNHKEIKKYILLVEGDSEEIFFPGLLSRMWVDGIDHKWNQNIVTINLKGKDKIQKDKIKDILTNYREDQVGYFLIIDNDQNVKKYIEDLKRESLLDEEHYILWENTFEDNFSEEKIIELLQDLNPDLAILSIDEIKEINSKKKDIKKTLERLMKEQETDFSFDEFKKGLARKLLEYYGPMLERENEKDDDEVFKDDAAFLNLLKKIRQFVSVLKEDTRKFILAD